MKKRALIFAAAGTACLVAGFLVGRLRKAKEEQEDDIPDCGGCFNNCSLAAPGCRIGYEKAEKYKAEHPGYQE